MLDEIKKFDVPTPKEIVEELDKYIIGQDEAKKAVAIAFKRRKLLPEELRDDKLTVEEL